MFKIKLWNVGLDRMTKTFTTAVDTLIEAEIIAICECQKLTGYGDLQMHHHENLEYGVFRGGTMVGSFSILSL